MTLLDLLFLVSVIALVVLVSRIAYLALRGRWDGVRGTARSLGIFLLCYASLLVMSARLMPRRYMAPGDRRCFDDWCVAATTAEVATGPVAPACVPGAESKVWIAPIQVSSDAKRIRQRAPDAEAELEDQQGRRYRPCAGPLPAEGGSRHVLSDELGPGESFRVRLPFRLPAAAQPAGLVIHHGAIPGVVIIGDDQSFLHPPTLLRIATQ